MLGAVDESEVFGRDGLAHGKLMKVRGSERDGFWEALKRDPLKGIPADANFHSPKFAPCQFP